MSSAFSIHLFTPEEIAILIEEDLVTEDHKGGMWPTSSWRSDAHAALVVLKARYDRPKPGKEDV